MVIVTLKHLSSAWKKNPSPAIFLNSFPPRYTERGDTVFYRAAPDSTSRPIISYNDLEQLDTDMF